MRIAIVDDEKDWRNRAFDMVDKYCSENNCIDLYESGIEFLRAKKEYDIVLMDIEMPIMDGFKTIEIYKKDFVDSIVIILTTHTDCARRGYLVDAFRYVDKINMEEELKEAIDKIRNINKNNNYSLVGVDNKIIKKILVRDILYIETEGRNSKIHTLNGEYRNDRRINDLEKELSGYGFFRCHKSFLINLNMVEMIDKQFVYFGNKKKAYISVRKYVETKRKYIENKKKIACM